MCVTIACMFAYMYACVCIQKGPKQIMPLAVGECAYKCVYMCMYEYIYVCAHVCVPAYMYVYVWVCTKPSDTIVTTPRYIRMYIHAYVLNTWQYTHDHHRYYTSENQCILCIYAYMYVCARINIHIHAYSETHMLQTHVHRQMCIHSGGSTNSQNAVSMHMRKKGIAQYTP
jgi:hypothetical protein